MQDLDKIAWFHCSNIDQTSIASEYPDPVIRLQSHTDHEWIDRKNEEKPAELYLIGGIEFVIHESGDDAGFADGLISQKYQFVFGKSWHPRHF